MPPLQPPRGNAMPLLEQLEAERQRPDFTLGETFGQMIPESLSQTYITGTVYKEAVTPPLARVPLPPKFRGPVEYRYKTPEEVQKEGDILYQTQDQYRRSKYYHPAVPFEKGMTENRAKVLFDWVTISRARDSYFRARPIASTIASLIGGTGDAANFIPFAGPIARVGWVGRGLILAAEGMGVTAASGLLTYPIRKKYDTEQVTPDAMFQDVVMAGITVPLLAALGAGGKAAWQAYKTFNKISTKPVPPAPPPKPIPGQTVPAPELATVPTPEPGAPVPEQVPVSEIFPEKPAGPGAEFVAPYGTYNLQTEEGVLASRVILNDAAGQINDGKDIALSPNSQSVITQMGPKVVEHLETTRYNMVIAQDIIEEQKVIQREIAGLKKKADASLKKATRFKDKVDDLYKTLTPGRELSPKEQKLIDDFSAAQEKATQDQVNLVDKQAEVGKLRFRRRGYTTETPDTLQDFDYTKMTSSRDLPPEIYDLLPPDVRTKIDGAIGEVGVSPGDWISSEIKFQIAPYLGRHYGAVYGYSFHGTSSTFERFDPFHTGKQTGAVSAHEGFWFTTNPGVAASEHYTKVRTVGATPEEMRTDIEMSDDTSIEWNIDSTDWVATEGQNIVGRAKVLEDRLTDIVPKEVKVSPELKTKIVNLFKEYLELEGKENTAARQRAIGKEFRAAMMEYQRDFPNKPNIRMHNIDLRNPYVYDYQGKYPGQPGTAEKRRLSAHILKAKEMGNDGVIFLNSPDPELGTVIVAFKPEQIEDALQPNKSIDWRESNSNLDVSWKVQETDLDKAAAQFSKSMAESVKFDKEMELDNIDPTKSNGVADPEIDRMDIEAAKAGMTEEQAKAFDEEIKAIEEEMASDDRITEASDAVIKCRNR